MTLPKELSEIIEMAELQNASKEQLRVAIEPIGDKLEVLFKEFAENYVALQVEKSLTLAEKAEALGMDKRQSGAYDGFLFDDTRSGLDILGKYVARELFGRFELRRETKT